MSWAYFCEVHVFEGLPLDFGDLVLGQVDGVDEPEVGEHLEVHLGQVVAGQVHSTDAGHRPEQCRMRNILIS